MTKAEFMQLMRFPGEWEALGMYPDQLFQAQVARYEPGDEQGAEHDRNGAFHWWLRQGPTKRQIDILRRLSQLDPDPLLGEDMRRYLDDPTLPPGYTVRD